MLQEGEFPLLLALAAKKNAVACLEILLDAGADLLQKFKDRTLLEINQSTHKRVRNPPLCVVVVISKFHHRATLTSSCGRDGGS